MSATEYPSFIVRSPTGPALPWRSRSSRRLETVALALAICLPVPMFAVLGLSLPLPNFVERIAAALVPWADPVTLDAGDLPKGAIGSIVPAAADSLSSPLPGVIAATPAVQQPSRPASGTAKPLPATPPTRPAATGGATAAPTALPTPGDEPAREPVALPKPAETPTRVGSVPAGVTETVPPSRPVPVVPTPPVPVPIPSFPTVPLPLPVPVQRAVDDVAADPVGTVEGIVGGIVPAPGGTSPPPLPLPLPLPLPRLGN